jgi:hypothetical protein
MTKPPHLILRLLVLVLLISLSTAEIKNLTITNDARDMIVFEKFGFTPTGHVTISVNSVSVASSLNAGNPLSSRLGFFLLSEESRLQVLLEIQQSPNFCVLDSHFILSLFTFRDSSLVFQSILSGHCSK